MYTLLVVLSDSQTLKLTFSSPRFLENDFMDNIGYVGNGTYSINNDAQISNKVKRFVVSTSSFSWKPLLSDHASPGLRGDQSRAVP